MNKGILSQLDSLNAEIEDIQVVMEKSETLRAFGKWVQKRHIESNIVCEINNYQELLSIDADGTIIKADNLLQIRYVDNQRGKRVKK